MNRIALITYDISPYRGSEASVSWNFVMKMSPHVHLTVLYGHGREDVERYLQDHETPNVEWVNIDPKKMAHTGLRGTWEFVRNFKAWQREVFARCSALVKSGRIDLIHYLNPIGFKEPGYCWKIKDVPYVWGPMQAVENRPFSLYRTYTLKGKAGALTRRVVHNALFRLHPRVRKAIRRANTIFSATPNTERLLREIYGKESVYLPENGIPRMERSEAIAWDPSKGPLQLIWVGCVNEERKAIGILLDALDRIPALPWHLHVIGGGEIRPDQQASLRPISDKVTFHGLMPREEVQKLFMAAHLHIVSSMGEGNPTTIWEAMAKGVPTLTLDHCGMKAVVCERCGIKIPIEGYDRVTARIANEIADVCEHPERVKHLSEGVLECSRKFMWENRIPMMLDTYNRLITSKIQR